MSTRWSTIERPSRGATLASALIAAVVVLAAAGGWFWYSTAQHRAAEAYADVFTRTETARAPQATPEVRSAAARDLERVMAQYPSAPAVARAAYELGNLRYEARQYAAARAAYEVALARGDSPTLAGLARLSVGYTWEAERDYGRAIEAFRAALAGRTPKDFLYEETLLALARVQALAGKPADAAETYRRLLTEIPGSRHADEVKSRLASLPTASSKP